MRLPRWNAKSETKKKSETQYKKSWGGGGKTKNVTLRALSWAPKLYFCDLIINSSLHLIIDLRSFGFVDNYRQRPLTLLTHSRWWRYISE